MQKTQWRSRTSCRKFWWLDNSRSQSSQWKLRISKQSPICNRGAGLGHPMDPQSYPCKTKTSQETQRSLQKFLEPDKKPKVIYTENSLESGESCEELYWNHIVGQRHTDQNHMGLQKEWRKGHLQYCCNQVWTISGGRIPFNVTATCERLKFSCLMGRHHVKGGSECTLMDQWYRLVHSSNITLFVRKTSQESINLVQKSCQVYSLDVRYTRGEVDKRHVYRRHWRIGADGRIWNPRPKAQCKGSVNANERW